MAKNQKIIRPVEKKVVAVCTIVYGIGCWYILFMSFYHFTLLENFAAILILGVIVMVIAWISLLVLKKIC
ncbi:hypothetical protein Q0590_26510 [Rhodocytophaga aerolata]|uniref:Uncharacterized protein n=1 Tax=Rhodocytophaga aerolata TaxID=455078 RepID=A0ABT8RGD5_9BACT|nr:hypothetical protein [Rhodocytophaga aerolata]MDO1449860.1 hypothetical protein [Rhodocytophaga aerolata]